jgi:hypothetical protein
MTQNMKLNSMATSCLQLLLHSLACFVLAARLDYKLITSRALAVRSGEIPTTFASLATASASGDLFKLEFIIGGK